MALAIPAMQTYADGVQAFSFCMGTHLHRISELCNFSAGIESIAVREDAHRPDSAPVVAEPAEESTSGDDAIRTQDDSSRQMRKAQSSICDSI